MFMMRCSGRAAIIFLMSLLLISSGLAEDAASEEMNNLAINAINGETNYTSDRNWENAVEVQGIWSGSLDESNIVMALNESDGIIFGLARSEGPRPWNGVVAGLLIGNDALLSLAAVEDNSPVSIHINCTLNDSGMIGSYVSYSSTSGPARGSFSAQLINPDISSYTPAPTEEPQEEEVQLEKEENSQPIDADAAGSEPSSQTQGRFNDVRQVAKGINPNIMPSMAVI